MLFWQVVVVAGEHNIRVDEGTTFYIFINKYAVSNVLYTVQYTVPFGYALL